MEVIGRAKQDARAESRVWNGDRENVGNIFSKHGWQRKLNHNPAPSDFRFHFFIRRDNHQYITDSPVSIRSSTIVMVVIGLARKTPKQPQFSSSRPRLTVIIASREYPLCTRVSIGPTNTDRGLRTM